MNFQKLAKSFCLIVFFFSFFQLCAKGYLAVSNGNRLLIYDVDDLCSDDAKHPLLSYNFDHAIQEVVWSRIEQHIIFVLLENGTLVARDIQTDKDIHRMHIDESTLDCDLYYCDFYTSPWSDKELFFVSQESNAILGKIDLEEETHKTLKIGFDFDLKTYKSVDSVSDKVKVSMRKCGPNKVFLWRIDSPEVVVCDVKDWERECVYILEHDKEFLRDEEGRSGRKSNFQYFGLASDCLNVRYITGRKKCFLITGKPSVLDNSRIEITKNKEISLGYGSGYFEDYTCESHTDLNKVLTYSFREKQCVLLDLNNPKTSAIRLNESRFCFNRYSSFEYDPFKKQVVTVVPHVRDLCSGHFVLNIFNVNEKTDGFKGKQAFEFKVKPVLVNGCKRAVRAFLSLFTEDKHEFSEVI